MAEKADRETTERRVYVLPIELVHRIREYQESQSIPSEVEAVRRLLDNALQMRDDVKSLIAKIRQKSEAERDLRVLARDVLAAHPLVASISFGEDGMIFRMSSGDAGRVDHQLNTYIDDDPRSANFDWSLWPKPEGTFGRPSRNSTPGKSSSHLDDDIPF